MSLSGLMLRLLESGQEPRALLAVRLDEKKEALANVVSLIPRKKVGDSIGN